MEPERPKKRKKKNKLAKKIDLKALAEEEADSEKRKVHFIGLALR